MNFGWEKLIVAGIKRLAESFSLLCHWGLTTLLSPIALGLAVPPVFTHGSGCMLKDDNSCVQAALQNTSVCVAVAWRVSVPSRKKWVYSCLIKQETNVAPVQRGWVTYFRNHISITMLCFVQEVICIYRPIFQQDKYDTRQDFPEVNIVNNKRLCQGKLRNDLILTHLYCNAKMPLTKLWYKLPV